MFKSQTPDCTFEQLREYVESALARDQDHTARATFRTHKRKKGTSVVSYVGELRNMGYRCYGSSSEPWTPAQVEERVLEVFLTNTGGELGRQLRMRFPRTLTEAIDIARNLEIEGVVDDSMEVVAYARNITNQANNVLNGRDGGNNNNQRGGRGGVNNRGRGRGRGRGGYQNNASGGGNRPQQQPQPQQQHQNREERECYYCGCRGHIARDCEQRKRDLGEGKEKRGGGKGKKGQNDKDSSSSD